MNKPTAEIVRDTEGTSDGGLYLVIKTDGLAFTHELPITKAEVQPIKEACEEWLEQESQRIMSEST